MTGYWEIFTKRKNSGILLLSVSRKSYPGQISSCSNANVFSNQDQTKMEILMLFFFKHLILKQYYHSYVSGLKRFRQIRLAWCVYHCVMLKAWSIRHGLKFICFITQNTCPLGNHLDHQKDIHSCLNSYLIFQSYLSLTSLKFAIKIGDITKKEGMILQQWKCRSPLLPFTVQNRLGYLFV